jgi:hypothetical protein
MKETTQYLENIIEIIHLCRKKNKKIGARLSHKVVNKEHIMVKLTGGGNLHIPILLAENGVSQLTTEAVIAIVATFKTE